MRVVLFCLFSAFRLGSPQGSPPGILPPGYLKDGLPPGVRPPPKEYHSGEVLTTVQPTAVEPELPVIRVHPLPPAQFTVSREAHSSEQIAVSPSSHLRESVESGGPVPPGRRPKKRRCPLLNPQEHSIPHPDTDISCEGQGFPLRGNGVACSCDFPIAKKDARGCAVQFYTFCTREEEDESEQTAAQEAAESLAPDTSRASTGSRTRGSFRRIL
ncbi:hypothetical protein QR680_017730 [Steinernema hermaphroditum]|uniref:Uncharacterized protein n=1 Tax=Steinernema hermaphroditum TaxID=289476 RepID=A0AA39HGK4_9BILA|nr:hypothetical protein QR680_017730 [Steinernema hermaphroditum]